MANLIARALSERLLNGAADIIPFVNRELIPLVRDIRTALNNRQAAIAAPTGGGTQDAEARAAINSIRAALTAYGITL